MLAFPDYGRNSKDKRRQFCPRLLRLYRRNTQSACLFAWSSLFLCCGLGVLCVTIVELPDLGKATTSSTSTVSCNCWRLQGRRLVIGFALNPGSEPSLKYIRWRKARGHIFKGNYKFDIASVAPQLWAVVPKKVSPFPFCIVDRAGGGVGRGRIIAWLSCAGQTVEWSASIVDTPHGEALRWRLRFGIGLASVYASLQLPRAAEVEGIVDGSPISVRRRPLASHIPKNCEVDASESYPGHGPERLLDGAFETEWFAAKDAREAWVSVELPDALPVHSVHFQWWGRSIANAWVLESRAKDSEMWVRREIGSGIAVGRETPSKRDPHFNAKVFVSGWSELTEAVRLVMKEGVVDPWKFGVYFGLRSFEVHVPSSPIAEDARELWGGAAGGPGLWFALEHPRVKCTIAKTSSAATAWSDGSCKLDLRDCSSGPGCSSSKDSFHDEVHGSLGFFEDGQHSQMRRAFAAYLEAARGQEFGQMLHYNSWFDMRHAPCQDGTPQNNSQPCYSHLMTDVGLLERLRAFNGNMSLRSGLHLDGFLMDDGWDNWDSLWDVDKDRFPNGFAPLQAEACTWGTQLGIWMSPWGGYKLAAKHRLHYGDQFGYEINSHGFSLAGPKYYASFREVARQKIADGFGLFKFDGIGGGLEQIGSGEYVDDFEAMLGLVKDLRKDGGESGQPVWISLTIGTWPSPFWLLWVDAIWRDGADVGLQGVGAARERWLTFRDSALRNNLKRGPLFPLPAFMQHGIVWSRASESFFLWPSGRPDRLEDFWNEVVSFFLSGTGLQEIYAQLELMGPKYWDILADVASYARKSAVLLRDSHPIGGDPGEGSAYGAAAFREMEDLAAEGVMWWRNPLEEDLTAEFSVAQVLELPDKYLQSHGELSCWLVRPLRLASASVRPWAKPHPVIEVARPSRGSPCRCGVSTTGTQLFCPTSTLRTTLEGFSMFAWELRMRVYIS